MPMSLLQLLARPDLTVDEIAEALDISLPDLCAKHAEPQTQRKINELESFAATRARIAAISLLPRAVDALGVMIQDYTETARRVPVRDAAERAVITEQQRQNARRACALLLRIANFHPAPRSAHTLQTPHTPTVTPTQKGEASRTQPIDTHRPDLAPTSDQSPNIQRTLPQKGSPAPRHTTFPAPVAHPLAATTIARAAAPSSVGLCAFMPSG